MVREAVMGGDKLVLLAAVALSVAACHPRRLHPGEMIGADHRPMRTIQRLDCPADVGELHRTAAAADGANCSYKGPGDEDVSLTLASLDGQAPDVKLAALDSAMAADLPATAPNTSPPASGVYVGHSDGRDRAHIDLPGFHLDASDGKATIRMPGVSVDADDDNARVSAGGARVVAHNGRAEIRAGGVGPDGADVTYLLASDAPGPSGYRAVGYVAKGPTSGPLVVAQFRTRQHDQHDLSSHGLTRLVDLNVHG
jgi:hypothetical protein